MSNSPSPTFSGSIPCSLKLSCQCVASESTLHSRRHHLPRQCVGGESTLHSRGVFLIKSQGSPPVFSSFAVVGSSSLFSSLPRFAWSTFCLINVLRWPAGRFCAGLPGGLACLLSDKLPRVRDRSYIALNHLKNRVRNLLFFPTDEKSAPKSRPRFFPSEITQKSSPGTRFGTQNGPELTSGRSKNPKKWEKSRFWTQ